MASSNNKNNLIPKTFPISCMNIDRFNGYSAVLEEHRKQCEMEGKYVGKFSSYTEE